MGWLTLEKLDLYFPFVVFGYGAVMTLILNSDFFLTLAEKKLPYPVAEQFQAHRGIGLICLVIGGLWTLQNLWLY